MIEIRQFKCGHETNVPRNMGRGQARVKRIEEYFNRLCQECAIKRNIENGKTIIGYNKEKNIKRIMNSYLGDSR